MPLSGSVDRDVADRHRGPGRLHGDDERVARRAAVVVGDADLRGERPGGRRRCGCRPRPRRSTGDRGRRRCRHPSRSVAVCVSADPGIGVAWRSGRASAATRAWAVVSAAATTAGATLVAVTTAASASVVHACGVPVVADRDARTVCEPSSAGVNVGLADAWVVEPGGRRPRVGERRRVDVGRRRPSSDAAVPSATVTGADGDEHRRVVDAGDGDAHGRRRRSAARIGDLVREGVRRRSTSAAGG